MSPIEQERRLAQIMRELEVEFPDKELEERDDLARRQLKFEIMDSQKLRGWALFRYHVRDWWDDWGEIVLPGLGGVAFLIVVCLAVFLIGHIA